jgi:hypothetical protein
MGNQNGSGVVSTGGEWTNYAYNRFRKSLVYTESQEQPILCPFGRTELEDAGGN